MKFDNQYSYRTFTMFKCLNLMLLLWFASCSETATIKKGKKGGNVTLLFDKYKDSGIFRITLQKIKNGKIDTTIVCDNKKCSEQEKSGIILKNLSFRDAGTYTLNVFYDDETAVLEKQTTKYELQIHDEISLKIGDKLKLDVLFPNVKEVKHQTENRNEYIIWKRRHEVQNNRLTVRDRTLTINDFTASDAGSYIVLDSEGEILIMVTVTESRTEFHSAGEHKVPRLPASEVMVVLAILSVFLVARMN